MQTGKRCVMAQILRGCRSGTASTVLAAGLYVASVLLLPGCDSGARVPLGQNPGPGLGPAPGPNPVQRGTVEGVVYAPDGTTVIAGALVYVPVNQTRETKVSRQAGTPPEQSYTSTTSGPDGRFRLSDVPSGPVLIRFLKGAFSLARVVSVTAGQTTALAKADTTFPATGTGAARLAVVTGSFDRIENVLAKLGLGTTDEFGSLQFGTQKFDIYNGGGNSPEGAPTARGLLEDPARLAQYNIVFINCGADEEPLDSQQVRANLRNYVSNGGSLYVTDLAYDYVEQIFPGAIDFLGSDNTPADQPEQQGVAELGEGGATDASVLDATMQAWLGSRNALTAGGAVHIDGLIGGFAVMNQLLAPNGKEWIRGPVSFSEPGRSAAAGSGGHSHQQRPTSRASRAQGIKPLTVTFPFGAGRVLYTSYHTVEADKGGDLLPQEQVLAYLMFEL